MDHNLDEVRAAGLVIGGDLLWTPENADRIREAFSVANRWRESHALPMRSMRGSLRAHMRLQGLDGLTAARLKRMNAIRGKLRRMSGRKRPLGLDEFQDLAGCRAILGPMADVDALVQRVKARLPHHLWDEDNYIREARPTGYRSYHLKYEFFGRGEKAACNGRRVEIQIRTTLQHAWATAVEAIGLFRGEELKSGKGSPEWLRLLKLMSAEFAEAERCDPPTGVPSQAARMRELRELDAHLRAADTLDHISNAVRYIEDAVLPSRSRPTYYLIRYDHDSSVVRITPYYQSEYAFEGYGQAESPDNVSGGDTAEVVLVEADKIESLPQAYPNYFGDVQIFREQLRSLCTGKPAKEYQVALQGRAALRPLVPIDPNWMRRRGLWFEPRRK